MSLLHRERPDWFHSLSVKGPVTELLRHRDQKIDNVLFHPCQQGTITQFEKVKSIKWNTQNAWLNQNIINWLIFESKYAIILHYFYGQVLAARQRARYLRLVRPPNSTTLKSVRGQIKRRTLLHKTARSYCLICLDFHIWLLTPRTSKLLFCLQRDLMLHLIMLSLILFVTYGKSDNDHKYPSNQAITKYFTK